MAAVSRRGKVDHREVPFNPRMLPKDRDHEEVLDSFPDDYDSSHTIPDATYHDSEHFGDSFNSTLVVQDVSARERIPSWLVKDQKECSQHYSKDPSSSSAVYCNATWDNIMCWPQTEAGTIMSLRCPAVRGGDSTKFAFRVCSSEGLWLDKNGNGQPGGGWTNYTSCFIPEVRTFLKKLYSGTDDEAQMKLMVAKSSRTVEIIGLVLSLVSLLLSLFIFYYFKKLHNNRTRIHKNLFVAMLLQVIVWLVLYVDQAVFKGDSTGLASSVIKHRQKSIDNTECDGEVITNDLASALPRRTFLIENFCIGTKTKPFFADDRKPIVCEAFYVILEYGRSAMFMWMFIEAMYLNNLISVAFFQGPSNYRSYYLIGWGIPVLMISLWAIVMAIWDTSDHCWTGYSFKTFYWILEGPRFIVIGANLLFLLNIVRILLSKLREANSSQVQHYRPLRRSVRNALFLLPLLGITNAITMIPKPLERSAFAFGIYSYATNLLTSFQGFVVACIYCFFNADMKRIFWQLKVALRPSKKTKNSTIQAFPNQDVFHSKSKGPKLHYKAYSRSFHERNASAGPNLQHLHPGHLSTVYDRPFLELNGKPAEPPFNMPTSPL